MHLTRLNIRRDYSGNLSGEIEVAGDAGKVSLSVNDDLCQRLIETCASELVSVAKTIAREMTAELITATKRDELAP